MYRFKLQYISLKAMFSRALSKKCPLRFIHIYILKVSEMYNLPDIYSSQHLKWTQTFHQSCPKIKMHSCLRTTSMNFFDPLQMLTTVYWSTSLTQFIREKALSLNGVSALWDLPAAVAQDELDLPLDVMIRVPRLQEGPVTDGSLLLYTIRHTKYQSFAIVCFITSQEWC